MTKKQVLLLLKVNAPLKIETRGNFTTYRLGKVAYFWRLDENGEGGRVFCKIGGKEEEVGYVESFEGAFLLAALHARGFWREQRSVKSVNRPKTRKK